MYNRLKRRTVVNVMRAWHGMKYTARHAVGRGVHPDLPKEDAERLRRQMRECVYGKGGEVSARGRTVELGEIYLNLWERGRARFLEILAREFDVDRAKISKVIEEYQGAKEPAELIRKETALREALTSDRVRIMRSFSGLPDGVKFLVDMREDLLPLAKKDPVLQGLENDLKYILSSWFDIGLLDMVQIDWNAPASTLEKLIEYEAVHAIRSWNDLKNRLDSDRRCFAFFHNKMPSEPLIFVEVALVNGLADSVQRLLDETAPAADPREADTAIFYSISNAQAGLAGISFGNFLIKRVVDKLSREFKNLKHFATLSPIPGFRKWLDKLLEKEGEAVLLPAERKTLSLQAGNKDAVEALKTILAEGRWQETPAAAQALQDVLLRLCARYLYEAKNDKGKALDPVTNFHLTNGARIERINWMADTSPNGMKQSWGMMVNYYYALDDIDQNHEDYVTSGRIHTSKALQRLMKP